MTRRLSLLLASFVLASCALPLGDRPPTPPPATVAPLLLATAAPPATQPTMRPTQVPSVAETLPTAAPAQPAVAVDADDEARIAAATPGSRDQIALAEAFRGTGDLPEVARTTPLEVKVGDVETFWVSDQSTDTNYEVTAELRYAGPVVLIYVDTSVDVDQADIERSAEDFEQRIYPRNRELFGEERTPGVDGDPRLTVLNTPLRGAGGYFSASDSVIKAANRFSNERDMFVIGINSYPIGSDAYASTLAHEFQHMIEWNQSRRSPAWFNEGMSTLAEDLNGAIEHGTAALYLREPDLQLTTWAADGAQNSMHYGLSRLFLRYFQEHYAGEQGMAELIENDAGNNLEVFTEIAARRRPDITSFANLYADWAMANVLNDPEIADGRYAYELLPGRAALTEAKRGTTDATVSQFGADYLGLLEGPLTLTFDGAESVGLTGAPPKDGGPMMWWSNRGDDSVTTLTRAFDLGNVQQATLQFSTWYEIERNWDYAFVTVSTDDGTSWAPLKGSNSTDEDPKGLNLGNGLTGVSGEPGVDTDHGTRGQWVEEQMDLTPYAGKSILLRFWVINDDAYNAQGMLIDDIRIPELNYRDDVEGGDGGWEASGFVRTDGELAQRWTLRLAHVRDSAVVVDRVAADEQGRATLRLDEGERALLAISGATFFTTEPAAYTYTIDTP